VAIVKLIEFYKTITLPTTTEQEIVDEGED
jgi:hypothetical protein